MNESREKETRAQILFEIPNRRAEKREFVRYLLKKTSVAAYDHPAKPIPSFKKCLRQRDYLQSGPIAK